MSGKDGNMRETNDEERGTVAGRVWSWAMRHKVLTGIGVLLAVILIHDLTAMSGRPQDNPQPTQRRLVQGSFPYDRGWGLDIKVLYYTRDPACRRSARAFGVFKQAEVTRQVWRTIPVVRDGDNHYHFEFFDDAILPGACDWQLQFVNYAIMQDGKKIQGGAILGFPGRFNVIRTGCGKSVLGRPDGIACLERETRKDPARTDYQVDYFWEEGK